MNKYLVDTTVLVEHLRGNKQAKIFLKDHSPHISTVSIAELIQGSNDTDDLLVVLKLCKDLPEIPIDKKISSQAIELMRKFYLSHGLKFLDALIASTALENKLILVTGNLKHFKCVEELITVSQKEILATSRKY